MQNIKIIYTKDVEFGKCNSKELFNLIKEYKPDLFFEELSQASYKECYEQDRKTLDTTAIKMYLEYYNVEHIPVIGTELSNAVFEKDAINKQHRYYSSILSRLYFLTIKHGFNFLNSVYCDKILDDITKIEKEIIENSTDDIIHHIYENAKKSIDVYENNIIENIYTYSCNHKYDNAIMFIDAWHRRSIMEKIKQYDMNEKTQLNWTFHNGEEQEFKQQQLYLNNSFST